MLSAGNEIVNYQYSVTMKVKKRFELNADVLSMDKPCLWWFLDLMKKSLKSVASGIKAEKLVMLCHGGPGHMFLFKKQIITSGKIRRDSDIKWWVHILTVILWLQVLNYNAFRSNDLYREMKWSQRMELIKFVHMDGILRLNQPTDLVVKPTMIVDIVIGQTLGNSFKITRHVGTCR